MACGGEEEEEGGGGGGREDVLQYCGVGVGANEEMHKRDGLDAGGIEREEAEGLKSPPARAHVGGLPNKPTSFSCFSCQLFAIFF